MFWRNERKLVSELEEETDGFASPEDAFRWKAAWHQAGHAVASHALGLPVLRVVLGAPPAGRRVEPGHDMSRHGAGQIYTEERTPPSSTWRWSPWLA